MEYGFFFDGTRCTGCKTCEAACKDYHDLDASLTYRRIYDYEGGRWDACDDGGLAHRAWAYSVSLSCCHCGEAVCVQVCPTGAMHKEPEGIVRVDHHVCVGCGYCEIACPYHAPHVSIETKQSEKCDGCYDRLQAGKTPVCVAACPVRALGFGPFEELSARVGCVRAVAPLPAETFTDPHLVIRPASCAQPPDDRAGFVANPQEV